MLKPPKKPPENYAELGHDDIDWEIMNKILEEESGSSGEKFGMDWGVNVDDPALDAAWGEKPETSTKVEKAGAPPGTIHHRKQGNYRKEPSGEWVKVTEKPTHEPGSMTKPGQEPSAGWSSSAWDHEGTQTKAVQNALPGDYEKKTFKILSDRFRETIAGFLKEGAAQWRMTEVHPKFPMGKNSYAKFETAEGDQFGIFLRQDNKGKRFVIRGAHTFKPSKGMINLKRKAEPYQEKGNEEAKLSKSRGPHRRKVLARKPR